MVSCLSDLLSPLTVKDFTAEIKGKNYWYLQGQPKKFSSLLSWTRVNRILEQQRFDEKRFRLVCESSLLPPESYKAWIRTRRGTLVSRLIPASVMQHLRDGATLVVDAVDELHQPLTHLAENIGRELHEEITINAYACWGISQGLGVHYDNHDVFILQISGCKHWKIYSSHLLEHDDEVSASLSLPVFDQIINSGDLIYIPHGWIHEAIGIGEPSLHLTLGIAWRNGIHLFEWLLSRLRQNELLLSDLPRFDSTSAQQKYVSILKQEFDRLWDEDILEHFFNFHDENLPIRSHFSLPWIEEELSLNQYSQALIRFTGTTFRIIKESGTKNFVFRFCGQTYTITCEEEALIRPLLEGTAISVTDLCKSAIGIMEEDKVLQLITRLIRSGVFYIENS